MPIQLNEETGAWELHNPTEAEKDSLMGMACAMLVDNFGEQVTDKILEHANQRMVLEAMPGEMMGNA